MNKLSAYILIISILIIPNINFIGFKVNLFLIKNEAKKIIKENYQKEIYVDFQFTKSQYNSLHFHKKDHEFSYNNMMYDIIKISEKNGKILLKCFADSKEHQLLSEFIKNNFSDKIQSIFSSIYFLSLFYENSNFKLENIFPTDNIQSNFYKLNYSFQFTSKLIKPPNFNF